ncbi:MAG: tRNA 2-thiouridine(34) synthase MnmA, partial [Gammaproteobacteria bacterium]|nr:tRNA 2-thiouridine(34) synthase MnmA [Gammaproteobacteria bacterium]
ATGHYAQSRIVDGHGALFKGADRDKDQSYFLHAVSAEAFAETVFPLGGLQKAEVRRVARDAGLTVYDKKDSTGICFIGERPFREFLSTYLPAKPGVMRTPGGEEIGTHQGLMYYTLGQRQGLGIGGRRDRGEQPWYVVAKHLDDNALIVAQGEHELLFSDALIATDACWIGAMPAGLGDGLRCKAKVRYRQADQACMVVPRGDSTLEVRFDTPQKAVAPGQFVVFYDGHQCLGGAVIDETA